ncbi:MAG: helix-turn-helix transcriptional regulator, partial [Chloroflexota bacterium]
MTTTASVGTMSTYLPFLVPLARAITRILGRRAEVVIHDLSNRTVFEHTIVAIEGSVTGRKVGGPPTDYLLKCLRDGWKLEDLQDYQVYPGKTGDGRPLRCASTLIRNESGTVIGAFCINVDVTDLLMARAVLDDL